LPDTTDGISFESRTAETDFPVFTHSTNATGLTGGPFADERNRSGNRPAKMSAVRHHLAEVHAAVKRGRNDGERAAWCFARVSSIGKHPKKAILDGLAIFEDCDQLEQFDCTARSPKISTINRPERALVFESLRAMRSGRASGIVASRITPVSLIVRRVLRAHCPCRRSMRFSS
jgi:hypothetical protein